jgi:hypothetical protein
MRMLGRHSPNRQVWGFTIAGVDVFPIRHAENVSRIRGGSRPERGLISERTRDGIAAARKCGRWPGRPLLDQETVSVAASLGGRWPDAGTNRQAAGHRHGYSLQDRQGAALKSRSRLMWP